MTLKTYIVTDSMLGEMQEGIEERITLTGGNVVHVIKAADVEPLIDASMRRQEALAANVNEGLLTIRALTADVEHAGLEFAQQHQQMAYDNERLHGEVDGLKQQLAASVTKEEHNRIVAQTITSMDEERTEFERQLAAVTQERDTLRLHYQNAQEALGVCGGVFGSPAYHITILQQQLTAMTVERDEIALRWQARVRVLEEAVNACIMRLTLLNQHGPLREQCERALGASVAAEGR